MTVFGTLAEGNVTLNNAATEETLQRLTEVAQQGFGSAGNNLATAGQSASQLGRSAMKASGQISSAGDSAENTSASFRRATTAGLGFAASIDKSSTRMAQGMRSLSSSPFMVADTMVSIMDRMGESAPSLVGKLTTVIGGGLAGAFLTAGDAVDGAVTGMIGGVGLALAPGLTAMFAGMFVKVLKDTNDNFINLQKNGALLGGSLLEARLAAHGSNLTMAQFNNVMSKASSEMAMFGGQTRTGAAMFGDLNKAVTSGQTGRNLLQLGIGFEDMGVRTAEMIAHLTESGISFENNAVAVDQARQRVVEIAKQQKALAAINGTTIEQEKEKQRMARKDAQLNAIMLGMDEKERQGIQSLIGQFPQFEGFIKETVAFGGPISKASLQQASLMGATTDALGDTIAQIQAGGGKDAVDALKQLQDTSPALKADLENLPELTKLSLIDTSNEFVQVASSNFQQQFELSNKMSQQVVDSVTKDFQHMAKETDALTNTIVTLSQESQLLNIEMTKTATNLISQSQAVQDLILGTTRVARTGLEGINTAFDSPQGLNVQRGNVVGTTTTVGATPSTNTLGIPDLPTEDTTMAPTTTGATTSAVTTAASASTGPIVTTSPDMLNAFNTLNNTMKNGFRNLTTTIQNN